MTSKTCKQQKILPPEGFVQLWVLINDKAGPGILGIGRTAVLNGVRNKTIPAPVKRGRTNLWRVEDIRRWIAETGGEA